MPGLWNYAKKQLKDDDPVVLNEDRRIAIRRPVVSEAGLDEAMRRGEYRDASVAFKTAQDIIVVVVRIRSAT